ncbi:unnamed protein product [Pedinophyceae sp. YPF-701]|nr:unnamed protein product [Pedinophyceae sp. YPF-701]
MSLNLTASFMRGKAVASTRSQLAQRRRPAVRVQALFGFGKSKDPAAEAEKEEAWRAQQELIAARRAGKSMDAAKARRKDVSAYIKEERAAREKAYREGKNVELPRGKKSKSQKDRYEEQNADDLGGIILPMAPFGMPEYDNGERWDLKAPYSEKGWVDEDASITNQIGKLFGFGRKKEEDAGEEKEKEGKK